VSIQGILYKLLNVPMTALLRSPLHGIASRNLCVLGYRGRKSGRRITTPLSYVRDGECVRLLTSVDTNWWKNFTGEAQPVELEIAGERLTGRAIALRDPDPGHRDGVRTFLTALPRDAFVYGIGLDGSRRPKEADLERQAGHVVLVEITLDAGA